MPKYISGMKVAIVVGFGIVLAGGLVIAHKSPDLFGVQSKPVREVTVHEEGTRAVSDLDALWAASDAVVHAVFLGASPDNKVLDVGPGEEPVQVAQTALKFQVIESFKSPPSGPLRTFEISRLGGRVDTGKEIIRSINDKFPEFELGQPYLLFLRRIPNGMYLAATNTPDSEFRLVGSTLESRGRSPLARSMAQKGAALLDDLRARAR